MDELRMYILGGGSTAAIPQDTAATREGDMSFQQLFAVLDLNGDGVICRDELRQGYLELILGEAREQAMKYANGEPVGTPYDMASAELATAKDAVVVCGECTQLQRSLFATPTPLHPLPLLLPTAPRRHEQ